MSAATMCERPVVTEATFRAAHPGLLEWMAALDDDALAWILTWMRQGCPDWML